MGKTFQDNEEDMDEFEADTDEAEGDAEQPEAEAEAPAEAGPASGGARSSEENPDERTVASRQKLREQMARETEEFLARGGKIAQIEPNVTADPPRKPDTDYGSRPI